MKSLERNKKDSTKKITQCKRCGQAKWQGQDCGFCTGSVSREELLSRPKKFVLDEGQQDNNIADTGVCIVCEARACRFESNTCSVVCALRLKSLKFTDKGLEFGLTRSEALEIYSQSKNG